MLTDETFATAQSFVNECIDELGELDPSLEGFIDLLEFAINEFHVALNAAKSDLEVEWDEL